MVALALAAEADPVHREAAETELLAITNAGMNGEIDFEESLNRRLALAPVTKAHMEEVTQHMLTRITTGMEEFFAALQGAGHGTWFLTAGIKEMMVPLAEKLGVPSTQILANEPMWMAGRLQRFEPGPLLKTSGKGELVKKLRSQEVIRGRVVMIGDGASDLGVFTSGAADDYYAYAEHAARPKVITRAPHVFRSVAEMRAFVGV
jgi:HAD superfamily phosphoserine phosphatase-like hydrolase